MLHAVTASTVRARGAAAALALLASVGCATFDQAGPSPRLAAVDQCDPDTAARLRFLEGRFARHARYANRWWNAWNVVYGGGIVVSSVQAGFEDDGGERADQVVNAVKSGIGLTRNLVAPPVIRKAPQDLAAIDPAAPDGCARRLARAEEILVRAAEQAQRERRAWLPHLGNLALNLVGAVIVAEGFDEGSGWSSGAIGLAVGEVRIWSYPWHAQETKRDYEQRFPPSLGGAQTVGKSDTR